MGIVSGGFCFKSLIFFWGFENKSASNLLPDVEKYLYELPVGFNPCSEASEKISTSHPPGIAAADGYVVRTRIQHPPQGKKT